MNGRDGSLIRALRGPITLITVGVLFALNNFTPYGFDKTWPVLLIVFGLLSLLRRGVEPAPPPAVPPPYGFPPAAAPGGYSRSAYTAPPAVGSAQGAVKGGFGTSAPTKPVEPGSGNAPTSGESV